MVRRRLTRASVALALLVPLWGCSASGGESSAVAQSLIDFHADVAKNDAKASCDLITGAGQGEFAQSLQTPDCPSAMALVAEVMTEEDKTGFKTVKVAAKEIAINDDDATVPLAAITYKPQPAVGIAFANDVPMHKEGGVWKLTSVLETDPNH